PPWSPPFPYTTLFRSLLDELLPGVVLLLREAEVLEVAHEDVGIEDAHHDLLAVRGRERREAQLHLLSVGGARLDAAILRAAFFQDRKSTRLNSSHVAI